MSLTEEDVKRWYDIAKKWGRATSAEVCRETFECVHDLSSFLKRLEKDLSEEVGRTFPCTTYRFCFFKDRFIHLAFLFRMDVFFLSYEKGQFLHCHLGNRTRGQGGVGEGVGKRDSWC